MKKVMISLLLCASFIIAKADALGIEVIESIENGDAEGLINALNRENPTQKELNLDISIAEKKFYSLRKKWILLNAAKFSSTYALALGAIFLSLTGGAIGAYTEFYLRPEGASEAKLWKGFTVGTVVGGGTSIKGLTAIESYLNLNQKIHDLVKRIKKARSIILILRDALQKREK